MGSKPRPKGQRFERTIAAMIEESFGPGVKAHRFVQSDGAFDSDVVVEGCPVLSRLWWECNHSHRPNPTAKLEQADRDCWKAQQRSGIERWPIAITRKTASRTVYVTTFNWVWLALLGVYPGPRSTDNAEVTVTWEHFVLVVWGARAHHQSREKEKGSVEVSNRSEESVTRGE